MHPILKYVSEIANAMVAVKASTYEAIVANAGLSLLCFTELLEIALSKKMENIGSCWNVKHKNLSLNMYEMDKIIYVKVSIGARQSNSSTNFLYISN